MTQLTATATLAHIGIATEFAESAATNLRAATPRWFGRPEELRVERLEAAFGDVEMARMHVRAFGDTHGTGHSAGALLSDASRDINDALTYLRTGDRLDGIKTRDAIADVRSGIAALRSESLRLRTAANVERASHVTRSVMEELESHDPIRIAASAREDAASDALATRAIAAVVD